MVTKLQYCKYFLNDNEICHLSPSSQFLSEGKEGGSRKLGDEIWTEVGGKPPSSLQLCLLGKERESEAMLSEASLPPSLSRTPPPSGSIPPFCY